MCPQDNQQVPNRQDRPQSDRSDAGQRATNRPIESTREQREQRKDAPSDRERQQNTGQSAPRKNDQRSSN